MVVVVVVGMVLVEMLLLARDGNGIRLVGRRRLRDSLDVYRERQGFDPSLFDQRESRERY